MLLLSLITSVSFSMFTQPLPMGLMIMIQTMMMAFISYKMTKLSWYAFILVMTLAGALLVSFIYVSVLTPAEPMARRTFWSIPLISMPTILLILVPLNMSLKPLVTNLPSPLFLKSSMMMTLFLTILLLMCLLIVVHNTHSLKGPMRAY